MKVKSRSGLYSLLFPFVWISAKFFYRKYKVEGLHHFPKRGTPCIVVSNHQNGLMDPLMCCLSAPRQLHFLTRADVFKPGLAERFVMGLNMLPVYRMHDKVDNLAKQNDAIFELCVKRLKKGAVMALFPEGNHGNKKTLRPLKKGLARLVYKAIEQDPSMEDIHIVPMGVHYEDYEGFRKDCVVRIGEAVTIKKWLENHPNSPASHNALMNEVKQGLQEVVLDLPNKESYSPLNAYTRFIEAKGASLDALLNYQSSWSKRGKPELIEEYKSLENLAQSKGVDLEHFPWAQKEPVWKGLMFFTYFPIGLLGCLLHGLPALVSAQIVKGKIKDPHFSSTFKLTFGMILTPLFSCVIGLFIGLMLGWKWMLGFLLGSFVLGIFAVFFYDQVRSLQRRKQESSLRKMEPELFEKWSVWCSKMALIKAK